MKYETRHKIPNSLLPQPPTPNSQLPSSLAAVEFTLTLTQPTTEVDLALMQFPGAQVV
ncbi:MAG: hypothetical protein LRZ84_00415 [Desertifilum sp.]|nr:hypothetical protein [Desertifilum sp.]